MISTWQGHKLSTGTAFTPVSLFGTTKGFLYDFSNAASVTTVSGGISQVNDLSPNGINATQATDTKRPTLTAGYASFDGTDDALVTPSIAFTTDEMTVVVAARMTGSVQSTLVELSAAVGTNNGTFLLQANAPTATEARFYSKGSLLAQEVATVGTSPVNAVLTARSKIGTDAKMLRVNGVGVENTTTDQGTGIFGTYPIYIGSRAGTTLPFTGRIYAIMVINRKLTDAEVTSLESWFTAKLI